MIFEIKNQLRGDDLIRFVNRRLPEFTIGFPRHRDYRVRGGVGDLVMKKSLEKQAKKKGCFVLTQGSDGNTELRRPRRLALF